MSKPYIDFAAVKSAVTMEQVLTHYGLLSGLRRHQNGDSYSGCCPIHKGTNTEQFKVSVSKNCWNCFGDCQGGGNVLDFVAQMDSITAHEAAHRLNEWFGLRLDPPLPADRTQRSSRSPESHGNRRSSRPNTPATAESAGPSEPSATPAPKNAEDEGGSNPVLKFELKDLKSDHPYLAERGLTPETVAAFGLGYCSKGTMSGRIAIPIHNIEGSLVGYAGRWPGPAPDERPKYKLPKDFIKSAEVFNLHRASQEDATRPLIVTEGFFDVMHLWQLGYRRTVSVMGSHLSLRQERLLLTAAHAGSGLILCFDEDDAGRKGREKALLMLTRGTFVRVAVLPREGAQPDDLTAQELQAVLHH
ncbi:MAG: CHC2 zinc finger domain-containing protein [Verrucomicrobiales bacterium]